MEEEQQIMDRLKEKERELEQNLLKIQDVTGNSKFYKITEVTNIHSFKFKPYVGFEHY